MSSETLHRYSCEEYARCFPEHFPVADSFGNVESAEAFRLNMGCVEVAETYHLYIPPADTGSNGYPRFDNVRTFLWASR